MDLALGDVAWDIEELDLVDRLKVNVILELPDDLLVWCQLEELGLLTQVSVAEVVAEDGIAIWQALTARHESQRVAW